MSLSSFVQTSLEGVPPCYSAPMLKTQNGIASQFFKSAEAFCKSLISLDSKTFASAPILAIT